MLPPHTATDLIRSAGAIRNSYSPLEKATSAVPEAVQYYFEAVQAYEDYLAMAPDAPDANQVKNHLTALKKPA